MAEPRTVLLVDALPYVFRAYYSLPTSMTDPRGEPVNAVHGFLGALLRMVQEESPTHVALAFDASLTTSFRNDLYPGYKQSREEAPAELEGQIERCRRVGEALGMAAFDDERYEADDLIGTLCTRLVRSGHRCVVATNDKDLGQLASEQVELWDLGKGERYGPEGVVARLGVRPAQVPDFLGLAGDAVDDIPGVPGVGAKTAAALLAAFDDLDALYADLGAVAELPLRGAKGLADKLAAGRELAFLSRELATIATDAPVRATLRDLAYRGADPEVLHPVLDELGFGRIRERIPLRGARR